MKTINNFIGKEISLKGSIYGGQDGTRSVGTCCTTNDDTKTVTCTDDCNGGNLKCTEVIST